MISYTSMEKWKRKQKSRENPFSWELPFPCKTSEDGWNGGGEGENVERWWKWWRKVGTWMIFVRLKMVEYERFSFGWVVILDLGFREWMVCFQLREYDIYIVGSQKNWVWIRNFAELEMGGRSQVGCGGGDQYGSQLHCPVKKKIKVAVKLAVVTAN